MAKKDNPSLSIARLIIPSILIISIVILTGCTGSTYPNPIPCGDTPMLIKAIEIANSTPATHDTIELDAGCIYKLDAPYDHNGLIGDTGLPEITSPITIHGHGGTIIRVEEPSVPKFRIFRVGNFGDLALNELTLQNGYAYDPLFPADVRRNSGGAIRNVGDVALYLVTIQNCYADGVTGGIFNEGDMKMLQSSISGCDQDANSWTMGGAVTIHNDYVHATALIEQSVIYGNGFGAYSFNTITNNETSDMTIENTTISGNGGAALNNDGDLDLIFCTITGHGLGIWSVWYGVPTVDMKGTLWQNSTDCNIAASVLTSSIFNMDSDGSCSATYTVPAPAQGLLPLANNGGVTLTHALKPSSPAIDAVMGLSQRECPIVVDQRGVSRPQIVLCDIGAYEYKGELPFELDIPPTPPEEAKVEEPEDPPTATPLPDRCDLFDSETATLTMHDIAYGTTKLELFVQYKHPLWGPEEEIPWDTRPWEFTATFGTVVAEKCTYREYPGRIYCTFNLTKDHFGYAYPLGVSVNFCDKYIYYHKAVSVLKPIPPATDTPTSIACNPNLNRSDCKASGGTFDDLKKVCTCP